MSEGGSSTAGCIGWSLFLLVAIGGMAYGGYYVLHGAHAEGGAMVAGPWGGGSAPGDPFQCGGNDQRTLEDLTVTLTNSPAINASGNCQLVLINCNVTAPVVIDAGGNAHVTIRGGSIHGTTTAISASGNANVVVEGGATIAGPVNKSGFAQVTGVP